MIKKVIGFILIIISFATLLVVYRFRTGKIDDTFIVNHLNILMIIFSICFIGGLLLIGGVL